MDSKTICAYKIILLINFFLGGGLSDKNKRKCCRTQYNLGKGLGTLHEDKPLDAKTIVAKTDVISAMEAIEGSV